MKGPGADVLAVACIVGGGLVAGGVTLALASGSEAPSFECATTAGTNPERAVVSLGDGGLVVVRPDVRVQAVRECMAEAAEVEGERVKHVIAERLHHQEAEREVERARREVERARREADRVRERVDRVRERVERARRVDSERAHLLEEEAAEHHRAAPRRARIRVLGGDVTERELVEQDAAGLPRRTFEFRLQGLEDLDGMMEGLEESLRIELGELEDMEFDFEGLEGERETELRLRLEEAMRRLEERLERVGRGSGS
jgi:hypothetical protein